MFYHTIVPDCKPFLEIIFWVKDLKLSFKERYFLALNRMQQKIIIEAKTWLGTQYHHQGRVKICATHNGGCDCIGLVIGVATALNLQSKTGASLADYDSHNYSNIPEGDNLRHQLSQHLLEKGNNITNAQTGDVVLFSFAKNPQHIAIIDRQTDELFIIHAYSVVGKVCYHRLDNKWQQQLVQIYSFREFCDR